MNTLKKAKSAEDDKYKFRLSEEPWLIKNDLIDIDLIQDHLPSFKYFYLQTATLEESCSEKYLIMYYQNQIYSNQKMLKISFVLEFLQNICMIFYLNYSIYLK